MFLVFKGKKEKEHIKKLKHFAKNNIEFMRGLRERCARNMVTDSEHSVFWTMVGLGVDETIAMSKMILR